MFKNIEKVCEIRCSLGEGPCWDEENNAIYWVDIIEKSIHLYDFNQNKSKTLKLSKFVGSIGLRKNGNLIAVLDDGFYFIDRKTGKENLIAIVEDNLNCKRFNDGKIDVCGNFWAGSVAYDERSPIGILYCLRSDLKLRSYFNNIIISNGIAWSLDNKKMYYIDTPTFRVDIFDFDVYEGIISNRKTALEIPKNEGYPDGMTIDAEGKLWIAHWGKSKVCRWDPGSKKIIYTINVPAFKVSSCIFGGKNLNELFITTAKGGFSENIKENKEEYSGCIFRATTNTRGSTSNRFNG